MKIIYLNSILETILKDMPKNYSTILVGDFNNLLCSLIYFTINMLHIKYIPVMSVKQNPSIAI